MTNIERNVILHNVNSDVTNSRKEETMKTRFEQIKDMDKETMTKFLCRYTWAILDLFEVDENLSDDAVCEYCPASKFCKVGHKGFTDWLDEEMQIRV